MWILKKAIQVKTSLFNDKNKPIYESREAGEPCPEATTWAKPELWCREVSDEGSDAIAALTSYKRRTGHELGSYVPPNKEKALAEEKLNLLKKLDGLKTKGAKVTYSVSDSIVILMKKAENAEKSLAKSNLPPESSLAKSNTPPEKMGDKVPNNKTGDSEKTDDDEFDIDD